MAITSLPLILYGDNTTKWMRMVLRNHFITNGNIYFVKVKDQWKLVSQYEWYDRITHLATSYALANNLDPPLVRDIYKMNSLLYNQNVCNRLYGQNAADFRISTRA